MNRIDSCNPQVTVAAELMAYIRRSVAVTYRFVPSGSPDLA
jgi:hypothetical protein